MNYPPFRTRKKGVPFFLEHLLISAIKNRGMISCIP